MPLRLSARDAHALGLGPPAHKYSAEPITVDGVKFSSTLEANHWQMLKRRERAGEITDIVLQPRYALIVNGVHCGYWIGDFRFRDVKTGHIVVQDAKGFKTPTYRLKKRIVEAIYGFHIEEVTHA